MTTSKPRSFCCSRLDFRIPAGLVTSGCDRRSDNGCRSHSEGDGVRHDCRAAVQVGLYTAFLPMVIYAVLGTSRPLSVSTTTTLAILTAAELGEAVPTEMQQRC